MKKCFEASRLRSCVAVVALALACAIAGCKDSDLTKAAKAADDISAALGGLETVNEQVYATRLIDAQETIAVSNAISAATLANDQFVANVRSLKKVDSSNKAQIVSWFGVLAQSLSQLSTQVSFGVKNPDARQQLQASFQIAQAAANVIAQMLSAHRAMQSGDWAIGPSGQVETAPFIYRPIYGDESRIGAPHLHYARLFQSPDHPITLSPDEQPVMAAFDPAALGALLALALQVFGVGSKVVETIRSESGMSDEDILAAAEKNDAATRAQLVAHIEQVNKDSQSASGK